MKDDVQGYFYKDYIDGDSRKTKERKIVGDSLVRYNITSMTQLCAMSEQEIKGIRNIGAKRRAIINVILEQYKAEKKSEKQD